MRRLIAAVCAFGAVALAVQPARALNHDAPLIRAGHAHISLSLHARVPGSGAQGGGNATVSVLHVGVPMSYRGGPVQQSGTTSYAIFWFPSGTYVSASYTALISRYFNDVGGSSLYAIAGQYYQTVNGQRQYVANASSFGGAFLDMAQPYPSDTLQDGDIQGEVIRAMNFRGWPAGLGSQFFVFTAKGENSCLKAQCSFTTYCAYHGSFGYNGTDVLYANQPYTGTDPSGCGAPTTPNGDPDADSTINVVSHEQMETVTDPRSNAWSDIFGGEIGDKCNFSFGNTDGAGANTYLNGNPYILQQEWSNGRGRCSLS